MLNIETIRKAKGFWERKEVNIPEWGGKGFVRTLTAGERTEILEIMARADDANGDRGDLWTEAQLKTVSYALEDEDQNQVVEKWEHLNGANPVLISEIVDKVWGMSFVSADAAEAAKKKFEIQK